MKKTILFLALGVILTTQTLFAQVPSYVSTNGLVGYWGFDGNASDQSGNGNNGTVNGATFTTDRMGTINKAYSFNNSNYIEITNNSSLNPSATITVASWVYLNQYVDNQNFVSKTFNDCIPLVSYSLKMGDPGNNTYVQLQLSLNGVNQVLQSSIEIPLKQWVLVTGTYDGQYMNLYINDVLNNSISVSGNISNYSTNLNFGRWSVGDLCNQPQHLNGGLDDIGIWNRALTQQEIKAMYDGVPYSDTCNAVSGSLTNGLVGYWPFCGNANDDSGNGNNGTVNGATLTTDRFGNSNSAYSFDGINNNIRVDIPNSYFKNDFTISTWVLLDDFKNTYPTFITEENSYLTLQFSNTLSPPVVNFYFLNNYRISGQQVEDGHVHGGAITLNTWINVAIVNSNNINKLYINGVYISSSTSQSALQGLGFGNYLKFGNGDDLPIEGFKGKLDDIGIWNRALTQQEITQLYNQNQCMTNITVTDTMIVNVGQLSYTNPIYYANNITLYPNPANTQVNISFNNITDLSGGHIHIINSLGQQVATTPITVSGTNTTLGLTTWGEAGLYFVQIINAQGQIVDIKKIILQ